MKHVAWMAVTGNIYVLKLRREGSLKFVSWKEREEGGTIIRQSTKHMRRLHFQTHSTFQRECSNAWKSFCTLNLENTEMGSVPKSGNNCCCSKYRFTLNLNLIILLSVWLLHQHIKKQELNNNNNNNVYI